MKRYKNIKSFVLRCELFCIVSGLLALGYCGIVLLHQTWFQARETSAFEQAIKCEATCPYDDRPAHLTNGTPGLIPAVIRKGEVVGRLEIPKVGVVAIVLEGDDSQTLRRAVGHIPGTALPWQPGNVGIAGHRDTFFRPLRKICPGDEITFTTLAGSYRYHVEFTRVVDPTDTWVLGSTQRPTITLVTCFPFYFLGPAPRRFVVCAHRLEEPALERGKNHDGQ